jgi:hypothetical protein
VFEVEAVGDIIAPNLTKVVRQRTDEEIDAQHAYLIARAMRANGR